MRNAVIERKTAETDIKLRLCLDGSGKTSIHTGIGFLDHMMTLFAAHGHFDLAVSCQGDLHVDGHHTTEDIAIALGAAFAQALGDKRGIRRYGDVLLPMDEALVLCAVDISGRSCLRYSLRLPSQRTGDFDTELAEEFFTAFTRAAGVTLHLRQLDGVNTHHILEAAFKGFGRAMAQAVSVDASRPDAIPSTKGVL